MSQTLPLTVTKYLSGGFPGGSAYLVWRECSRCSNPYLAVFEDVRPCPDCDGRRASQRRRYERRKANTAGSPYVFDEVALRDGWRCHICHKSVDPNAPRRSPLGASIDHLIPVAEGGGDEAENVALAHLRCNIKRSTGGLVQLRLVG